MTAAHTLHTLAWGWKVLQRGEKQQDLCLLKGKSNICGVCLTGFPERRWVCAAVSEKQVKGWERRWGVGCERSSDHVKGDLKEKHRADRQGPPVNCLHHTHSPLPVSLSFTTALAVKHRLQHSLQSKKRALSHVQTETHTHTHWITNHLLLLAYS